MRFDVLNLILGWTLVALTIPLLLCVVATGYLDNWELAIRAFSIPAGLSLFIGSMMLRFGTKRNTHMRLRDRAFAAVALVWPLAVFIGALPYWLGGMFHGPNLQMDPMLQILHEVQSMHGLNRCRDFQQLEQRLFPLR